MFPSPGTPRPPRPFVSLLLAVLVGALPRPAVATTFVTQTASTAGYYNSLAVDAFDVPSIAFFKVSQGVCYASRLDGTWNVETIEAVNSGPAVSLRLNAQGNPCVSYQDQDHYTLKYASRSGGTWTIESVQAGSGSPGEYNGLALDASGNPRIAFIQGGQLKYAARNAGVWTVEVVESALFVAYQTSLQLDASGNPRIAYFDATNARLRYASKSGSTWTRENADASSGVGVYASLALDGSGNPRVSYYDATGGNLKYAAKSGGTWTTEVVDNPGDVGLYTSLALDAGGNPRISYQDGTAQDLKYAAKNAGVWTKEVVLSAGNVGSWTSLRLSPVGKPHIACLDFGANALKYSDAAFDLLSPVGGEHWKAGTQQTLHWSGTGTVNVEMTPNTDGLPYAALLTNVTSSAPVLTVPAWVTTKARVRITRASPAATAEHAGNLTIVPAPTRTWVLSALDAYPGSGTFASMVIDPLDLAHVSYRDAALGDLRYVDQTQNPWLGYVIDITGDMGQYSAIALGPGSMGRISYYDASNQMLRHAAQTGPATWTKQNVDGPLALLASAVAVDAAGNSGIAYADGTNHRLRYASNSGGTWTLQTVEQVGSSDTVTSVSIRYDPQNAPCIAYTVENVAGTAQLKYARGPGGVWTTEVVDGDASAQKQASLRLDSGGNPRIAYARIAPGGWTSGSLRYAAKSAGVWTIETVDGSGGLVGGFPSLVLDATDHPHVSYAANTVLMLAEKPAGTWTMGSVDTSGQGAQYTAFGLTSDNYARLAYYNPTASTLRFASEPDVTPPATIANLYGAYGKTTIVVGWTAPGDDGTTGTATEYDLRYSSSPIYEWTFSSCPRITIAPPNPAGSGECVDVPSNIIHPCSPYYFAIKTRDEVSNWSGMSNVTYGVTRCNGPAALVVPIAQSEAVGRFGVVGVDGTQEFLCGNGARRYEDPELPRTTELDLLGANPSRGSSVIQYGIPGAHAGAVVDIGVFDVLGRQVAVLAHGPAVAGRHVVVWERRGAHGERAERGIYYVRMRVGAESRTRTLVAID